MIDVERLGQALHMVYCRRRAPMHSERHHSAAAIVAEYERLQPEATLTSADTLLCRLGGTR